MPTHPASLHRSVFAIGLAAVGVLAGCAAPSGVEDTASGEAAQTSSSPKSCKTYSVTVRSGTGAVEIAHACTQELEAHMTLKFDKAGAPATRFSFDSLDHAEDKARLDARLEAMTEGGVPRATLRLLSDRIIPLLAEPRVGEDPQIIFRDHLLAQP